MRQLSCRIAKLLVLVALFAALSSCASWRCKCPKVAGDPGELHPTGLVVSYSPEPDSCGTDTRRKTALNPDSLS